MTKPLTVEQAIKLLKKMPVESWLVRRERPGMRVDLDMCDYHALLALLEGLRWRKVGEERPHEGEAVFLLWFGRPEEVYIWNGSWRMGECQIAIGNDHFWMPLPLPPAGEPAENR